MEPLFPAFEDKHFAELRKAADAWLKHTAKYPPKQSDPNVLAQVLQGLPKHDTPESEWQAQYATTSVTAENCFYWLRLEMCSPGSLNHFLQSNEAAIRDAMVTAAVDWVRAAWPEYVASHGGGSQWLGPTSANTPSP